MLFRVHPQHLDSFDVLADIYVRNIIPGYGMEHAFFLGDSLICTAMNVRCVQPIGYNEDDMPESDDDDDGDPAKPLPTDPSLKVYGVPPEED